MSASATVLYIRSGDFCTSANGQKGTLLPSPKKLFETYSTPRGRGCCVAPEVLRVPSTDIMDFCLLGDKVLAKQSLYYSKKEFCPVRKMERLTDIYITGYALRSAVVVEQRFIY